MEICRLIQFTESARLNRLDLKDYSLYNILTGFEHDERNRLTIAIHGLTRNIK